MTILEIKNKYIDLIRQAIQLQDDATCEGTCVKLLNDAINDIAGIHIGSVVYRVLDENYQHLSSWRTELEAKKHAEGLHKRWNTHFEVAIDTIFDIAIDD